jgi:hypothetical protein
MALTDYIFLTGTALTVRGGSATSLDAITLTRSGSTTLSVSVDVSNDFLGGGDLPAFTTTFPASAITSIRIEAGAAVDTINVNGITSGAPLTIASGDGNDVINIGGGNFDNVSSNVTILDGAGGDTLTLNDLTATTFRNATLTSTSISGMGAGVITYVPADFTQLTINGSTRGNTFNVNGAGATGSSLITTLNTGTGVDNVFLKANVGRVNINGMNGLDNVRIGNAGSVAGIVGQVFINNVGSRSAIFVDDFASTAAKNWSVHGSAITTLAPGQINYVGSSTRLLEINTGTGDDVANIYGTSALDTTINSAAGNETMNFFNGGAATLPQKLNIMNVSGQSSLFIDASGDTVARSLTLTSNSISGVGFGPLNFDPNDIAALSFNGGNGGNTYNIVSTIPGKTLTLYGGSGSDTAIVRGPFTSKIIYGGGPNLTGNGDLLQVIGTGSQSAVYTPSSVMPGDGAIAIGGQLILFTGLEAPATVSSLASLKLVAPNGGDTINIDSPVAGQNRISGSSGGVPFAPLSFSAVPAVTLDLSTNEGSGANDIVTVGTAGLNATGLSQFNVDTGGGSNLFSAQGGNVKLNNPNPGAGNLTVNASGSAVVTLAAGQRLAGMNLSGSARVNVPAGNSYLHLGGLSIAPTASLDLFDNDLIIQSTSGGKAGLLNNINGYLKTGRNRGAWSGAGIRSTAAGAVSARNVGLAAIVNDRGNGTVVRSELNGQAVDANTILIKYTYDGDSDLNGMINADDYARIDSGYATRLTSKGYYNGDFDYSGLIDADDYFLIDRAMGTQGAVLAGETPVAVAASSAPATPPVPEPVVAELEAGETPTETRTSSKTQKRITHHRRQPTSKPVSTLQLEGLARFFRAV